MTSDATAIVEGAAKRARGYRWVICGLLFAATAINYIDRQMIGVLKPVLQVDLGWSEAQYADIVFWFQAAYAIGFIGMGRFIDVIGARLGYAVAFTIWTLAHVGHGLVHSVTQFTLMRFALGVGESGNFPAGLKAVADWFPQRERAFAIGLFNAGANVGAILTPLLVPALTLAYGWRFAFIATGAFSVVWLIAWLAIYRTPEKHPRVSPEELALIRSDPVVKVQQLPWRRLFLVRETWAYAVPKFLTDPIWWMFLFWLPDFLGRRYGLDLKTFGPPLVVIYILSDFGSVIGGWTSSRLIRAGLTPNRARKFTMLGCAFIVLPIVSVQYIDSLWLAVLLIGLATAGHQAFSANLLTLPSDIFQRGAIGSVVGIGGTAGAIGGMLIAKFVGHVLEATGSYALIFGVAGGAYFVALGALHLLSPRLAPVRQQEDIAS
ncbi:ACS family hexuronate transporter-like MFS transporter [Novosphingobium chloroacetimidivorans]|uniref:ACS family hexuronate transporter-like MFS transporter n=1 Tax=Novosphingobium chloroacetimidivorans TaxID=1428314 RepID=A0A7W7KE90_9SPHN|nr:MFS transporter [Novosphingobium chloroacetimidivorans]MBB4860806.1 ACS family hexuronate transporter-like MFS transporter [Novosphingobium chloroacetimidivorans]